MSDSTAISTSLVPESGTTTSLTPIDSSSSAPAVEGMIGDNITHNHNSGDSDRATNMGTGKEASLEDLGCTSYEKASSTRQQQYRQQDVRAVPGLSVHTVSTSTSSSAIMQISSKTHSISTTVPTVPTTSADALLTTIPSVTTTATAAPTTRPPSRISLNLLATADTTHNNDEPCYYPSQQPASRPVSATIVDVSHSSALPRNETVSDPPAYIERQPQDGITSTLSVSAAAATRTSSSSSATEDYSVYHHYPLFAGSGGGPGAGTSASHARMASTPFTQQQQQLNQGASSSISPSAPQLGSSPLQQEGSSPAGARVNATNDETMSGTGAANMPTAMFRRPFLEEDELPEYMSLPEFGLPFKIPPAQSITYTVIPSQGPVEFQRQLQQLDEHTRTQSIEEPLDPDEHSHRQQQQQQQQQQQSPSIILPSSASSVHGEVRLDIDSLSPATIPQPRQHQGHNRSQRGGGPWTLEYWVDDTMMYLLYLMDPKHSATTSLVPRTTAHDLIRGITVPVAAPIEPSPGVMSFLRASEGRTLGTGTGPQIEVQEVASPVPERTSTSTSWRSQNRNSLTTPRTSVLSGLSTAPRQHQHTRQPSNHSNSLSLSVPATTMEQRQQGQGMQADRDLTGQGAVIIAIAAGNESNPFNTNADLDDATDGEEGDGPMERVPVGHIRGRPPPLTRRNIHGWPSISRSTVEQLSSRSLFSRQRAALAGAPSVAQIVSTTSPAPEIEQEASTATTQQDEGIDSAPNDTATASNNEDATAVHSEQAPSTETTERSSSIGDNNATAMPQPVREGSLPMSMLPEQQQPSSSLIPPPGTMVRTLPSIQHIQINDGYAGEEEDTVLAHALQATVSQGSAASSGGAAGNASAIHRNNAFNNALTSEFFKHPSFAFVSAEDPQTWIWWSTHHEKSLQRCRQEGPMEEVMMWWRTRLDYKSKENKERRRLEKLHRMQQRQDRHGKDQANQNLYTRWRRYISLEASTPHRQSMEITMRVRGLYYAWREEEIEDQHQVLPSSTGLPPPPPPPISPQPGSMHTEGMDFDGDQGSQLGMTSIRPRSTVTTPFPPPQPPALLPATSKKLVSRFFQLVRDDSLVMGQRVKGGPVAEVWITEELDDEEEDIDQLGGGGVGQGHHHRASSGSQHHGYASTPTYQSVLDTSPTSSPAPAPYYPLVRSNRSSSVTSNNGNTFMTDVSAATGGPVRSSTMTGPLIHGRPMPSGRSYASSSRYPFSELDTPAPSFQDAMTTGAGAGGAASGGYYGPSGGGHGHDQAQSHRRQRSSVAFSSSRSPSIAPTDDENEDQRHHHDSHRHGQNGPLDLPLSSTPASEESLSSFPKSLHRRKCTIRVMKTLNDEVSTFVLSTGPRLPELFDLFTDQSMPGPTRGVFICSIIIFAMAFLVIFFSLAFTHHNS